MKHFLALSLTLFCLFFLSSARIDDNNDQIGISIANNSNCALTFTTDGGESFFLQSGDTYLDTEHPGTATWTISDGLESHHISAVWSGNIPACNSSINVNASTGNPEDPCCKNIVIVWPND